MGTRRLRAHWILIAPAAIKVALLVLRIFYQLLLLLYSSMSCPRFDLPLSLGKIAFTRKKMPMSNERRAENESIY